MCLKCESGSSRFQPGKGPSRGLLRDYEPSDLLRMELFEALVPGDQHYTGCVARYECSVNTLPKISHSVDLVVEDTEMALQDSPDISVMEDYVMDTTWTQHNLRATIQGPKTQYVSEGSTVALQCRYICK